MTDRRTEDTDPAETDLAGTDQPVARDLPDQQPQKGEDPLDVPVPKRVREQAPDGNEKDLPEPDESGAGSTEHRPSDRESQHLASDETTG